MAPGDTQGAQNCELATILLGTLEVLIEVSVWELEEATTEAVRGLGRVEDLAKVRRRLRAAPTS